jgi:hypothetical protein
MKPIKSTVVMLILAVSTLLVSACSTIQPIQTINNQPTPKGLSKNQVAKAIKQACVLKGWHTQNQSSNVLVANYNKNHHYFVSVTIPYSAKAYSIHYRSSKNLMAKHGKIHHAYNRWVRFLDQMIQVQLTHAAHPKLKH